MGALGAEDRRVIRFNCSCGKRLKVDYGAAGRTVECPYCGMKVRAPSGNAAPRSGHDELVTAMRSLQEEPPDDVPVAEVVAEPPAAPPAAPLAAPAPDASPWPQPAAEASPGKQAGRTPLDALVKSLPPKPAATSAGRPAKAPRNGKASAGKPARTGAAPGAKQDNRTIIIAVGASVLLVILLVIVSLFVGGSSPPKEKPKPPEVIPSAAPPAPAKRERDPHPPGDLFPQVPVQN
jgi:hypothetical protein